MDAFLTPEARREVEALRAVRPPASTWGFLIGHRRGPRFIVEKVFPAGSGRALPDGRRLAGLDGVWPGRVIGLFAIRPGPSIRKAVLGPAWYGKLFLRLSPTSGTPAARPFIVEFGRKFSLVRIPFAPDVKAKARE